MKTVTRMKVELDLGEADSYAPDTLARIRDNVGATYVVLGSYLVTGAASDGQIRLDLRIQDAAAGATVATLSESGAESELLDLVARAGAALRRRLGVGSSPGMAAGVGPANARL